MTNTNRPVTGFSPKTSTDLPQEPNQDLKVNPTQASARPDLNTPPEDSHRVPDMNEAQDHPVATGAGAVGGVAAGAAIGSAGGPVGSVVGGIVGGVVGGLAGNELAAAANPAREENDQHPDHLSAEDHYWKDEYHNTPYYNETRTVYSDLDYDRDYRGAYRVGYENRPLYDRQADFNHAEPELQTKWEQIKGDSRLSWEEAKFAVKDAWHRATR